MAANKRWQKPKAERQVKRGLKGPKSKKVQPKELAEKKERDGRQGELPL